MTDFIFIAFSNANETSDLSNVIIEETRIEVVNLILPGEDNWIVYTRDTSDGLAILFLHAEDRNVFRKVVVERLAERSPNYYKAKDEIEKSYST